MATKNQADVFAQFANQTYTAKLESLNGAEVEYRRLTASESDYFQAQAMASVEFNEDGEATPKMDTVSLENAANIKYEKLAICLVTPEKTADDFKGMSTAIINELVEKILTETEAIDPETGFSEN